MGSGGQSWHQNMPILNYRYRSYVFVFQLISWSCFNSGVGWRVKVLGVWRTVLPCVGRIQRAHYYMQVKYIFFIEVLKAADYIKLTLRCPITNWCAA